VHERGGRVPPSKSGVRNMVTRTNREEINPGLSGLRTYDAGPDRVERIRARCVAALAAQRRQALSRRQRSDSWRRRLEPIVAFSLSALYLVAAFISSVALYR
jgi:hypothetical protein